MIFKFPITMRKISIIFFLFKIAYINSAYSNDIDKVFKEFEKFTSESWDDKDSNLFCEGL